MNILISNVYSWKNKGDAGIILSMIDHVQKDFPGAKISISSIDHNDIGKYNEDIFELNFLSIVKNLYSKAEYSLLNRLKYVLSCNLLRLKLNMFEFFAKRDLYIYSIFPTDLSDKIKAYQSYDLIIAAGGGYFISKSRKNKLERYLNHDEQVLFAYDFYLATFFNKPYILYNQSIGPFFSTQDELNLLPFFKKSEAIICREQLTYDRMEKLELKNLILSEDAAFNLQSTKNNILQKYSTFTDENNIGFTVRNCLPDPSQKIYEHEVSLFINKVLQIDQNTKIYFMPQVTYEDGGDNDLHVAKRVLALVDKDLQNHITVIDEDIHPCDLKYMIGEMNYFFGTRMHSCIFALASNVKTIALSYEPKTDGIMKSLKMDDYFINVKDVTEQKLLDLYQKIMDNKTYYEKLEKEVGRVQKESLIDLRKILRRQI